MKNAGRKLLSLLLLFSVHASSQPVFTKRLKPNVLNRYSTFQKLTLNDLSGKWEKDGIPFKLLDTFTNGHAYKWKREDLIAIQDLKKINGKWTKSGIEYSVPDTLKSINLLTKK